jgi:ABC-type Fe3+-hydroxamate transport system substrate-binding protein
MAWLGTPLESPASRVVSLVPSLTESVMRLGGSLTGRTSFCPGDAPVVGGPKDAVVDRILELEPDLILASPSENGRATVEAVAAVCPVWLCDPKGPDEAPALWRELGELLGRGQPGRRAAQRTQTALDEARRHREARGVGGRFVCWVWREPWVAAGPGTWIAAVLEAVGLRNAVLEGDYPRVADPASVDADVHLLPSEPFAFGAGDLVALGGGSALPQSGWFRLAGGALAALVPGEPLIWYPSHTVEGLALAREVREVSERVAQ